MFPPLSLSSPFLLKDKEKKAEVLALLGPMPEEQYAMLVSLSKKITDYGSEKGRGGEGEGEKGRGGRERVTRGEEGEEGEKGREGEGSVY